jgi:hypothetical protein
MKHDMHGTYEWVIDHERSTQDFRGKGHGD